MCVLCAVCECAQSLLMHARLAGDAVSASPADDAQYGPLVERFSSSVETLAEAVNSLTVDVDRKIEEKAAAARAAEEVRRKTHLSRVRKELSEAARTCGHCLHTYQPVYQPAHSSLGWLFAVPVFLWQPPPPPTHTHTAAAPLRGVCK